MATTLAALTDWPSFLAPNLDASRTSWSCCLRTAVVIARCADLVGRLPDVTAPSATLAASERSDIRTDTLTDPLALPAPG